MLSHEASVFGARRQFGVGRNRAKLLLAFEHALAIGVPAVVELALVLVGPLLEDVVRPVDGAGSPVHEERLVRRKGLMLLQPGERLCGHVLGKMVLGSCGGSTGLMFSYSRGSYWEVSPARKP